ncbi:MAG: pyrroline-5-carboxylate reductase, partial [Candidatus Hydrogenedentes bacterium]|nr:pyrroline-5-carboxylate reductase [Candidatus Hydrogenedentota bacterium]
MQSLSGRFGFLGYGNMGGAIVSGLLTQQTLQAEQIFVYDPAAERMVAAKECGIHCAATPQALIAACDTLVLAVKPQALDDALAPVIDKIPAGIRVISIMAGISITALQSRFGKEARIIRVMPNTPALVGAGAAALACSDACSEADAADGCAVFEAVGTAEIVPESHIDAVTALSGSGPAYFFYLVECLVAAAVAEGLPEETAQRLAGQTLMGAGQLLVSSGKRP